MYIGYPYLFSLNIVRVVNRRFATVEHALVSSLMSLDIHFEAFEIVQIVYKIYLLITLNIYYMRKVTIG